MRSDVPRQLPLLMTLDDSATFANFYVSVPNQPGLDYLQTGSAAALQQFTYLWGAPGAGCSHLLQALCHLHDEDTGSAFYVSLQAYHDYSPDIFEGLDSLRLVCLDDIQAIIGDAEWERALFTLFNRLRESGTRFLVGAKVGPRELPCKLQDLLSRLQSGVCFQLHALSDDDKLLALQLRARQRGLALGDEIATYILQRHGRSTGELFDLLERLDQHSLQTRRRLTIPLVREILENSPERVQSEVL
jgi:DnaA family protein